MKIGENEMHGRGLKDAALEYAGRGWKVFPCQPRGKEPLTPHGFKDASTDPGQIEVWWSQHPEANIGVRTGEEFWVVDVDVKDGKDGSEELARLESEHGELPETPTAKTGGGGYHLYFEVQGTAPGSKVGVAPGIDIRGTAGYVIAPPSVHPSGQPYIWQCSPEDVKLTSAPQWLLDTTTTVRQGETGRRDTGPLAGKIPEGRRNQALFQAGSALRQAGVSMEAISQTLLDMNAERCEAPLPQSEVQDILRSIAGWSPPQGDGYVYPNETELVRAINADYCMVRVGGRVCVLDKKVLGEAGELQLMSVADFKVWWRSQQAQVWRVDQRGMSYVDTVEHPAEMWIDHRDQERYERVGFDPGGTPPGVFNLFRGFRVEAIQGDCSLYWSHVLDNICKGDQAIYDYVRKWMSHAVQRPGQLPETALVIIGRQGTGKDVFVKWFGKLFGEHFKVLHSMDQVTGRFNAHLSNALLIQANEALWGGKKDAAGALKGMVTDEEVSIEAKGKDIVRARNFRRMIVTTNEPWPVPRDSDDRRFLVLESGNEHKLDLPYFAAIKAQMESGGLEALMYDLMSEDLTNFEIRAFPATSYGFPLKLKGMRSIERWVHDILRQGVVHYLTAQSQGASDWPATIGAEAFHDAYLSWCEQTRVPHPEDIYTFGKCLRDILPTLQTRRLTEPATGRRVHTYVLPTLDVCRSHFEEFTEEGPYIWDY